nr:universal stress protein [Rhodopirellula sp. SM50]
MKKNLILCPVDFSESTELAISLAVDLANAGNSKVILLHVIAPDVPAISINQSINNRLLARLRRQYLDLKEVDWEQVTRHGNPAETVITYARQSSADLIVMGTQGRTGLASLVVGSVARRVMNGAHCPVVTVKTPSFPSAGSWQDEVIAMGAGS